MIPTQHQGPPSSQSRHIIAKFDAVLAILTAALCVALGTYKVFLIRLLNVNWDEFSFLTHSTRYPAAN